MFTYGPGRVPPPLHLTNDRINPHRQTKRVYIGNLPEDVSDKRLREFYAQLLGNKLHMDGEPITVFHLEKKKGYAYMELRTPDEATAALSLDGEQFGDVALTVKRPVDYVGIDPNLGLPVVSGDSNNKLFIGGLPTNLNSDQVMELLKSFGELRTFNLVKEGNGSISKGFAFAEFLDPAVTDMAIQGLNGFQLGDRAIVVQRAATSGRSAASAPTVSSTAEFLAQSNILQAHEEEVPATRVMLMLNMVTPDELYDDQEYSEILEDVRDECGKFGQVEGVRIPRPVPKSTRWEPSDSAAQTAEKNRRLDEENGVGRVYVMYANVDGAQKAMKALGGRQFGGRTILVAAASDEDFLGPAPPPPPEDAPPPPEDGDMPPPPPPPM
jgi:splicing factor U2AF subunit